MTDSATIAGVRVDALSFGEAVEAIVERARGEGSAYVVTPNAHHVVLMQDDAAFREIYRGALLSLADGVPLLWAAGLLGTPLRGRVNGTDLFEALCARAATLHLRVFFLGGREGAAAAAAQTLRRRHPDLEICGTYCPPFGFESDLAENEAIVAAIAEARPHLLFVGLGAPKQERWIARHAARAGVPVSIGIGVSFEFVGGIVTRAPRLMQRTGLEWLFRLSVEPRRLWRRYVLGNAHFCILVARQYASGRRGRPATS